MNNSIYKGDDTSAFGNNFVRITIKNPDQKPISKIEFNVNAGIIIQTFTDTNNFTEENIVLIVNLNSEETSKLSSTNVANVICYDMNGKQFTCRQTLRFSAVNGVICRHA